MAFYPVAFWPGNERGEFMDDPDIHEMWHDQEQEELRAVQAELGIQPSGAFSDVATRLNSMQQETVYEDLNPTGNLDVNITGAFGDWATLGNLTVPTWCTSAFVQMNSTNIFQPTTLSGGSLRVAIGSVVGIGHGFDAPAVNKRFAHAMAANIAAPVAGTRALKIQALTYGQILRADILSTFSAIVTFK